MGKFSKYADAALKSGKTVKLKLNMLPGAPTIHVEHLGENNAGYWTDLTARAGTGAAEIGTARGGRTLEERQERRKRNRETLARHAVRQLDAKHDDGTPATNADIPEWCEAIPPDVVDMIFVFALDPENFREHSFAATADLAEK
jgi:hypothetical protein